MTNRLAIGFEIEGWGLSVEDAKTLLPTWLIETCDVVYDGSLGREGYEVVLPPLAPSNEMWQFVSKVCGAMTDIGTISHKRCGIHMHVSNAPIKDSVTNGQFNELSKNNWFQNGGDRNLVKNSFNSTKLDWQLIKDVVKRYTIFQPTFNSMLAPSRTGSRWCHVLNLAKIESANSIEDLQRCYTGDLSKYSTVNISTWSNGTVEFRQHHSTLEMPKLKAWCKLITNMYQWSLDNRFEQGTGTTTVATPDRHPSRRNSRIGIVYQAIRSENGATVSELMEACGNTANNIRRLVSELRTEFSDNAIVTHTQQANGASYRDGEQYSGYTMLTEYTVASNALVPLPENRSGNLSIWSGLDDETFEFIHDRIEEIASRRR